MMHRPLRIAFVGTYPPTACGIATFTESLRSAVVQLDSTDIETCTPRGEQAGIIRLVNRVSVEPPREVIAEWVRGSVASVRDATRAAAEYDCVILQHEFGIYAGPDGDEVVEFLRSCPVPVMVVLHTVLASPTSSQHRVMEQILAAADLAVVQTRAARDRLLARHDTQRARLAIIPHGAAANFDGPRSDSMPADPVLLTWGLIGPGKGIEHVIRAVAIICSGGAMSPSYLVVGRTHPNVLACEGERYRDYLLALADELGVGHRVRLDASYLDWAALRATVRSADLVVLPYDSRDQVTSGVLVEAMASARPVVATAFPHAIEALASGAGTVVPHANPAALAEALDAILASPERSSEMCRVAQAEAASFLWPRVGQEYLRWASLVSHSLAAA